MDDYKTFLLKLVDRYDGDGSNGQGPTLSEEVFSNRIFNVGDTVVVVGLQYL